MCKFTLGPAGILREVVRPNGDNGSVQVGEGPPRLPLLVGPDELPTRPSMRVGEELKPLEFVRGGAFPRFEELSPKDRLVRHENWESRDLWCGCVCTLIYFGTGFFFKAWRGAKFIAPTPARCMQRPTTCALEDSVMSETPCAKVHLSPNAHIPR